MRERRGREERKRGGEGEAEGKGGEGEAEGRGGKGRRGEERREEGRGGEGEGRRGRGEGRGGEERGGEGVRCNINTDCLCCYCTTCCNQLICQSTLNQVSHFGHVVRVSFVVCALYTILHQTLRMCVCLDTLQLVGEESRSTSVLGRV